MSRETKQSTAVTLNYSRKIIFPVLKQKTAVGKQELLSSATSSLIKTRPLLLDRFLKLFRFSSGSKAAWTGDGRGGQWDRPPRTGTSPAKRAPQRTEGIILFILILPVGILNWFLAGRRRECWGKIADLCRAKPAAALKTGVFYYYFLVFQRQQPFLPSISSTVSSHKKIPNHKSMLSNSFSTPFSQPCLWSPRTSHHRDPQEYGQLHFVPQHLMNLIDVAELPPKCWSGGGQCSKEAFPNHLLIECCS